MPKSKAQGTISERLKEQLRLNVKKHGTTESDLVSRYISLGILLDARTSEGAKVIVKDEGEDIEVPVQAMLG